MVISCPKNLIVRQESIYQIQLEYMFHWVIRPKFNESHKVNISSSSLINYKKVWKIKQFYILTWHGKLIKRVRFWDLKTRGLETMGPLHPHLTGVHSMKNSSNNCSRSEEIHKLFCKAQDLFNQKFFSNNFLFEDQLIIFIKSLELSVVKTGRW